MEPASDEEKVFVAVPAKPRAGQSTLSWALGHLYSSRATTIVLTHVHVPPQMIPVSKCVLPPRTPVFRPLRRVHFWRTLDFMKCLIFFLFCG
jgi:hypothetical protein